MKVQFGAIITRASGRLGGHVIRNHRGQVLMTRLALPTKSNAFRANPQIARATKSFKEWSSMTSSNRTAWNDIARSVRFVDVFGNTYYKSGRGLVSYLYINGNLVGYNVPDANTFDSTITTSTFTSIEIDIVNEEITFTDYSQIGNGRVALFLKVSNSETRNFLPNELKYIGDIDLVNDSPDKVWQRVIEVLGSFNHKSYYTFGVRNISESCMASSTQTSVAIFL